jgi:hypothetical protein
MVLGKPGDRIAELVSAPGLLGHLGENLRRRLCRIARPHQMKMPNSIARSSSTLFAP